MSPRSMAQPRSRVSVRIDASAPGVRGPGPVRVTRAVASASLDHNGYPAAAVALTFRTAAIDDRELARLGRATRSAAEALSRRIRGRA